MVTRHPAPAYQDLFRHRAHSLHDHHRPGAVHFTWNARGALFQLLTTLPARTGGMILVPAFHCIALVKPILAAGFELGFYRIRTDLTIDVDDLAAQLHSEAAAVLVIHYFGFPADLDGVLPLVRARGALLIEDCSHAFLTRDRGGVLGHQGDYAVFSYYKCAPSGIGGALVANGGTSLPTAQGARVPWPVQLAVIRRWLMEADARRPKRGMQILHRALAALSRRGLTQRGQPAGGGNPRTASGAPLRGFLDDPYLFDLSLARAGLPWYARRIVESSPWDEIALARRRNYAALSRLIPDSEVLRRLIPDLPDGVVPYMFPVYLRNRRHHEQALREAGVPLLRFGETLHHELEGAGESARTDAEDLSGSLLLLPVHQDLDPQQIGRYVARLLEYVAGIPSKC
jgi:dTDP-4-amino-4,6-dideoxygalactose transaminase